MTQAAVDVADTRIPELSSRMLLDGLIYFVTAVPPLEVPSKPPHVVDALYRLYDKIRENGVSQTVMRRTSGLSMYFVSQLE